MQKCINPTFSDYHSCYCKFLKLGASCYNGICLEVLRKLRYV